MTKQDFYAELAALLGTEVQPWNRLNDVIFRRDRKTGALAPTNACRWFGREPGNGRFPGFGTVRAFGPVVHVVLRHPIAVNRRFDSFDAALAFLREHLPAPAAPMA